jgi:hypothetical protein
MWKTTKSMETKKYLIFSFCVSAALNIINQHKKSKTNAKNSFEVEKQKFCQQIFGQICVGHR